MPTPHHSSFLQAGCPSCRPTSSVKALKAHCVLVHWCIKLVAAVVCANSRTSSADGSTVTAGLHAPTTATSAVYTATILRHRQTATVSAGSYLSQHKRDNFRYSCDCFSHESLRSFYRCDAMLVRVPAVALCLPVCLCLSVTSWCFIETGR